MKEYIAYHTEPYEPPMDKALVRAESGEKAREKYEERGIEGYKLKATVIIPLDDIRNGDSNSFKYIE